MMRRVYSVLFPEEIVTFLGLGLLAWIFVWSPLPLRWFDPALVLYTLLRLAIPALVFGVIIFLRRTLKDNRPLRRALWESAYSTLRVWSTFYLALVIHTNIKINVGNWRTVSYDQPLWIIDQWLRPAVGWLVQLHQHLDTWFDIAPLYVTAFELMFMVGFCAAYWKGQRQFRELFAATIFVLLLGTLGYLLWPVIGPFMYGLPQSPYLQTAQAGMFTKYYLYTSTGGTNYPLTFLVQGIAAMPSLHFGHAVVFLFFMWRDAKWLLPLFLPVTIFIGIEALYGKYHYFLDLVVGTEIAGIAIILALWTYAKRPGTSALS